MSLLAVAFGLLAAWAAHRDVPCRSCAHPASAHDHDRGGTDCSACRCPRYRRFIALT